MIGPWAPTRRVGRPGWSAIVGGLIIGEYPVPADVPWLVSRVGVNAVVNLQDHHDLAARALPVATLERCYAEHEVEFHHLPTEDTPDAILAGIDGAVDLLSRLRDEGRTTYLHCNAGANRAPTFAIAWLHAGRGLDLDQAIALVQSRRPCAPYLAVLQRRYGSCRG